MWLSVKVMLQLLMITHSDIVLSLVMSHRQRRDQNSKDVTSADNDETSTDSPSDLLLFVDNRAIAPVDGKCPWSYDRFWVCADQSACVGRWALCNNVRECRDDSDEADCEDRICEEPSSEWLCDDKTHCVQKDAFCNGRVDCNDRSDELVCQPNMECTYTEWRCLYFKQCVSLWKRCDGIKDCGDFTDEQGCDEWICLWNQLKCTGSHLCIDRRFACDGKWQCADGEDERGCDEWTCPQQAVVTEDGSIIGTGGDLWRCDNMECVHRTYICNDIYDCRDKSDERRCLCARFCESDCKLRGVGKCDFRCFKNYTLDKNFECVPDTAKTGEKSREPTKLPMATILVAVIVALLLAAPLIAGYVLWCVYHRTRKSELPDHQNKEHLTVWDRL